LYKIVYDNIVIDVIETIKYARYLSKSKHTAITDKTSANCIIGSNNKDRYHIKGIPYPKGCNFKTVSIIEIDEKEYNELLNQLSSKSDTIIDSGIRQLKQKKIKEMSEICHNKITNGIRVVLSDNKLHHFELSIEDQVNLLEIKYLIDKGESEFIYHETDCLCKSYSLEDMQKIIDASFNHKQYHLTYFNKLKNHINKLQTINEIIAVEYGINIER
jgi:hypothetical protein